MGSRLNPIDQHVGKCMRARRAALRMSQTDLGKEIGVTFQQVQKYEMGINRVAASRLQRLADALGVSVEFFFEDAAASQRHEASSSQLKFVHNFISSDEGIALVRAFARLDTETKRCIVHLVEEIARYEEAVG